MKGIIIVSGYFGSKLTGIYNAPRKEDCYFFSNNLDLKEPAIKHGWKFIFDANTPISAEPRIASLQSKYVKFLQFDKALVKWEPGQSILYFDHKFEVKSEHIDTIQNLCTASILIRNTPLEKLKIQDEVNAAIGQKRYREVMKETIEWANKKLNQGEYSPNNRIMNTGLILYSDVELSQKLCDEVYNTCWLLGQPECQIIWGILSQPFESLLTRVAWQDLDILWKEPTSSETAKIASTEQAPHFKNFLTATSRQSRRNKLELTKRFKRWLNAS